MRIALIADTFPPHRTSGAVQLRDLSREFAHQGHELTVMIPSNELNQLWQIESMEGFQVLHLRAPKLKNIGHFRRTISEFMMPFLMRNNLQKSPLANEKWDGVVWYAPSIFHGPLASMLKKKNGCKGYLILRDIFPDWAVDMGLLKRGLPYYFFNAVARYQYSVADVIGVQTKGNLIYFSDWSKKLGRRVEVLQNWLTDTINEQCSIQIIKTPLAGRKIFVYAGNMGIAQGMDILVDLAEKMKDRKDIGFLFVGRGSEAKRLSEEAHSRELDNLLFFDEIHPDEISSLYAQCSVGLVALDPRHQSHNIPGKFLTYLQNGLPILANVNKGNDLAKIIQSEQIGQVCESNEMDDFLVKTEALLNQIDMDPKLSIKCRQFFDKEFSTHNSVKQIVASLAVQ
jgi:glycosyltransferase involved in cell wall biosynthesis